MITLQCCSLINRVRSSCQNDRTQYDEGSLDLHMNENRLHRLHIVRGVICTLGGTNFKCNACFDLENYVETILIFNFVGL